MRLQRYSVVFVSILNCKLSLVSVLLRVIPLMVVYVHLYVSVRAAKGDSSNGSLCTFVR